MSGLPWFLLDVVIGVLVCVLVCLGMAFIFHQQNSKYWYAGWKNVDGKRVNRSTKLEALPKNRRLAQKVADEYEDASKKQRSARHVREVISDLHQSITGEDLPVVSLRSHCQSWLARKKPEVANSSYTAYRAFVDKLLGFFKDRSDLDINLITRNDLTSFRNSLAKHLSAQTVNTRLKALRMLFKDADREGILIDNPAIYVDRVKADEDSVEKRPFTLEEVRKVSAVADTEWKSMIMFGLYTGQRLGDIARLRWSNLNMEAGSLTLKTQKTGHNLRLSLHPSLTKFLKAQAVPKDKNEAIHPESYDRVLRADGKVTTLSNQFIKLLADAGLREKPSHRRQGKGRDAKRTGQRLSFHCLRHTTVTMLHEAGVAQASAQAVVGHDSAHVHKQYTHIGDAAVKDAIDKLPEL